MLLKEMCPKLSSSFLLVHREILRVRASWMDPNCKQAGIWACEFIVLEFMSLDFGCWKQSMQICFLNTFSALLGLIVAWQIKKRSFVPVSDCRFLLLCNKHCQSVQGIVNWYSLSLFTTCSFCNLGEMVLSYFARFYFKTDI